MLARDRHRGIIPEINVGTLIWGAIHHRDMGVVMMLASRPRRIDLREPGRHIGAVLAGLTADALGLAAAMWVVAALTLASGLQVALRMQETQRR